MATTVYEEKIACESARGMGQRKVLIALNLRLCFHPLRILCPFFSFHAFSIAFLSINFNFPKDEQKANLQRKIVYLWIFAFFFFFNFLFFSSFFFVATFFLGRSRRCGHSALLNSKFRIVGGVHSKRGMWPWQIGLYVIHRGGK